MIHEKDEVVNQLNLITKKVKDIKENQHKSCEEVQNELDDIAYIARLVTADIEND